MENIRYMSYHRIHEACNNEYFLQVNKDSDSYWDSFYYIPIANSLTPIITGIRSDIAFGELYDVR